MKKKPELGMTEKQVKEYLNSRVWAHFCKWMTGQTCPVLSDEKGGYFKHDVERYANGILEGKPTYWD